MSGSARAITLKLSVEGAARLQEDLRNLGVAGEDALRRLEAAVTRSGNRGAGLPQISAAAKEATSQFGAMTPKIQSAGYQIQDFAVQVQGGTSAMTAISQQASQFLGAFGPAGAIAGAILTVGILTMKLLETASSVEEINKANQAWAAGQRAINSLLETTIEKTKRLRNERISEARGAANNEISQGTAAIAEADATIARLQGEIGARRTGALRESLSTVTNPGARRNIEATIARREADDAAAQETIRMEQKRIAENRAIIDRVTGPAGQYGEGKDLLEAARLEAARRQQTAGMKPGDRAVAEARFQAEDDADEKGLIGKEKEELIRLRVASATDAQTYATSQLAAAEGKRGVAEEKRFATAMRVGDTELLKRQEELQFAQAIVAAETPREAMLARQAFELQKATLALRGRIEAETDPRIKASLTEQVALITQQRQASLGLEETIRNKNALYQQGAGFARQAAQRQGIGMADGDRARFMGEFGERQRIKDSGDQVDSADALARIQNAGDLAYGDEQLQRLQEFTSSVRSVGDAFTQSFTQAGLEGRKLGDVLDNLQRQIAASIFKSTLGRMIDQGANAVGSAIGGYFFGGGATAGTTPTLRSERDFSSYNSGYQPGAVTRSANGNVMTDLGPMPLRKYAGGGVAHSPQVSIFGEGRQPEAYVPLPDGRSIPVKMAGGGGTSINIDARGADAGVEQRIDAVLARRMPAILAAGRADLTGRVNQGGNIARTFGRR
tara:strand:- start:28605 stop:30800 length:2196 start_codon:yes stop_codon:yes gene_type:complete